VYPEVRAARIDPVVDIDVSLHNVCNGDDYPELGAAVPDASKISVRFQQPYRAFALIPREMTIKRQGAAFPEFDHFNRARAKVQDKGAEALVHLSDIDPRILSMYENYMPVVSDAKYYLAETLGRKLLICVCAPKFLNFVCSQGDQERLCKAAAQVHLHPPRPSQEQLGPHPTEHPSDPLQNSIQDRGSRSRGHSRLVVCHPTSLGYNQWPLH